MKRNNEKISTNFWWNYEIQLSKLRKYFILEIIVDLIIKNQRNHGNHYASQQR